MNINEKNIRQITFDCMHLTLEERCLLMQMIMTSMVDIQCSIDKEIRNLKVDMLHIPMHVDDYENL
jgi:hypothetical protein